jgi:drug/metabolite transporter (DMT)-like permease
VHRASPGQGLGGKYAPARTGENRELVRQFKSNEFQKAAGFKSRGLFRFQGTIKGIPEMSTRLAYLGIILIWSTTPLAIKWSSEGVGFQFAATSRMVLGMLVAWVILLGMKQKFPLHTRALKMYLVSGLNIYTAMTCIYWASQYVPSGWVAVVFGLSPVVTGVMAMLILKEDALLPHKILGMLLGMAGLFIIFGEGYTFGREFLLGIGAVIIGMFCHSISAVLVKHIGARISGIAATTGGLTVAVPLFTTTWLLNGEPLPAGISWKALYAILYLGVIASSLGFAMYYYVLSRMDVGRVSLITLITPVLALLLGDYLNNEPISTVVLTGTGCIVAGLFFYQFGYKIIRKNLEQE